MNTKISTKKKIGYTALVVIMVFCMMCVPVDMMWHGGQVPNWLPFRYSFLLSFTFLTMAATTWGKMEGVKKKHLLISLAIALAVVLYVDSRSTIRWHPAPFGLPAV